MKTVAIEKVKSGMTLAKTVTNANFVVILLENTVLNDKHVHLLKSMNISDVAVKDEFDLSKLYQQAAALKNKDSAFVQDFEKIAKLANKIFDEIKLGGEIKSATAILAAKILPLADNPASVNYLFKLGHMNTSLAHHCERVAIFSGIIAKWMNFSWEEIRVLVTAAFMHDVGKYKFPPKILSKTSEDLTGAELKLYQSHCQIGKDILTKAKFPEPIPTIVFQHHEHMNGSGFPNQIRGNKIHMFAKIIAIADAYDNMIVERLGAVKKTPFDAVNHLIHGLYTAFDPAVCIPLLTRIKDNLVGSNVTLNDGRTGRVIFYPKDFSAMPIVVLEDGDQINLNRNANLSIVEYHIS